METDRFASHFRDLVVYQEAFQIAHNVFELSKPFPGPEMFAVTDQIRRSERSIGAQIAEAWTKRRYRKHFVSKLTDADAEVAETMHWLAVAEDCSYTDSARVLVLERDLSTIGRRLSTMIRKADEFCQT